MILKSYLADIDDSGGKKLRLAIKGMALASSRSVLREEAIFNFVHDLYERLTVDTDVSFLTPIFLDILRR